MNQQQWQNGNTSEDFQIGFKPSTPLPNCLDEGNGHFRGEFYHDKHAPILPAYSPSFMDSSFGHQTDPNNSQFSNNFFHSMNIKTGSDISPMLTEESYFKNNTSHFSPLPKSSTSKSLSSTPNTPHLPSSFSSSSPTNTETKCQRYPMPSTGIRNYPYNFSSLRLNGTRLLKPLNWYDAEIIQIIEDILEHDITVESALNRIYYITGDRPSKRILQQRVRRFRENRYKQKNEEEQKSWGENVSGDLKTKLIASERIKAFYNNFLSPPRESEGNKTVGGESDVRMMQSSIPAPLDLSFLDSPGFNNGLNKSIFGESTLEKFDPLFSSSNSEVDNVLQNFQFSNVFNCNEKNASQNCNFSKTGSCNLPQLLTPSLTAQNFEKHSINSGPIFSPLDSPMNECNDKPEIFGFNANFPSSNCKVHKISKKNGQINLSMNSILPLPSNPSTSCKNGFPAFSKTKPASCFQSIPNTSIYKSLTSKTQLNFFSPPTPLTPNFNPSQSSEEDLFGQLGFSITAERVDAMIDQLDHDWIKHLLDETDDGSENHSPKILNPYNIKNICINIENILNFMKQSITVFSSNSNKYELMDGKKWKTFGNVLNDLLKLKDVFEAYENENTTAIINRQSFIHDVIKWICGDSVMVEVIYYPIIPKTNLNVKQFRRFIQFLKDFNSNMFDYTTNYEALFADSKNDPEKVAKLSSVLANCVSIITDIVACVTVDDEIECDYEPTFAKL